SSFWYGIFTITMFFMFSIGHGFLYLEVECRFAITSLKCFEMDIFEKERILNSITWAPRIWGPWDNLFDCRDRFSYGYWSGSKQIKEVQKTDSNFLQSGTMQRLFRISQLIWDLRIHSFSYSKIMPLSLCFHKSLLNIWLATVKKEQIMTKDETLLVFRILLFMVLISATRNFRERTKSNLVKIMIWSDILVITFAIVVHIYPIFIFFLRERIKPLEVSLSRYWDRLINFLDCFLWACAQRIQKGEFIVTFSCHVGIHLSLMSNLFWILKTTLAIGYHLL
ncbi:hypothetical protein ACJX0J_041548, partial [Zea mays]